MSIYEIRKDGITYCRWTDPALTPDRETLKSMSAAGYRLYIDGKLSRKRVTDDPAFHPIG